ncbi:vomeronasal type-2 receptor 26-like [Protopterus annectens]|uniref:vomeronasal type-2 receptor 26-like n=1 Tax=Protopterus annectens TaxID=7888 RepID=UPI001CF9528C|nr:vomeronasal type-2 receptor 26-like [Protopterus annectens]
MGPVTQGDVSRESSGNTKDIMRKNQQLTLNFSLKHFQLEQAKKVQSSIAVRDKSLTRQSGGPVKRKNDSPVKHGKVLFGSNNAMISNNTCKRRSTFIPVNLPVTTAFHNLCEADLRKLYGTTIKKKRQYNLNYDEHCALKKLQFDNTIVMKQADKGDATNCVKCPDDLWADDKRQKCVPKIKEFLTFADPLGASLTGISVSASVITVTVLCIFIKFRNTPVVKANNRELSYILLSALVLCFICSLIFIGKPTKISCILHQTTFGIVFSICISSVLAKTVLVVIAFNATNPSSKTRTWGGLNWIPISIFVFSSLLQIIICTVWLFIAAPFPENNMKSETGKIIIECNEGSAVMFYGMLGYLGLLAGICFVVAFLARNLPDGFNETKYITLSMLAFISVWLSFIPAYLSTKGKYTVAVEIFAILASSTGLLICIFSPKVYIIMLRPELNTREKLARK